jgi:hypothetical protein
MIYPIAEGISIAPNWGLVGMTQVPKWRNGGTDQASATGVLFGTPLYVPPPATARLRNQIVFFQAG